MSSDIDPVLISCYKIQYVFGSACPFAICLLECRIETAGGRIFMDSGISMIMTWPGPGPAYLVDLYSSQSSCGTRFKPVSEAIF